MRSPVVSVVIPAYNASAHLDNAIRSVLSQTYSNFEILIVDDESIDDTAQIASLAAQTDERIHVLSTGSNSGGPARPRNVGIAAAIGDYVAFLDADDEWLPDKLTEKVEYLERNPSIGMVSSFLWTRRRATPGFGLGFLPTPGAFRPTTTTLLRRNSVQCSSVLIRRALIVEVGPFEESHDVASVEDYDMWLRVLAVAPVAYLPRLHGYYAYHLGGLSKTRDIEAALSRLRTLRGFRIRRRSLPGRLGNQVVALLVVGPRLACQVVKAQRRR